MNVTSKTRPRKPHLCFACTLFAFSGIVFQISSSSGWTETQSESEIERARARLAADKYPLYISAVESFNEELGKMKDGPQPALSEEVFRDSIISFDRRIEFPLENTRILVFKICAIGPCGDNIVFVSSDTTFTMYSFYLMYDTSFTRNLRLEVLVELLNRLFQLEKPREFATEELLYLITKTMTIERSWLTILRHEDDVIMPSRGREKGILKDKELKELEERHIAQERIRYAREGSYLERLKDFGIKEPRFTTSQEGLQFTLYVLMPQLGAYRVVLGFVDRVFILKEKTASGIFPSSEIVK